MPLLGRYRGQTRIHTESDLRVFLRWCTAMELGPLTAVRADIERYVALVAGRPLLPALDRSRRLSVVVGFYRVCVVDQILPHSPAAYVRDSGRFLPYFSWTKIRRHKMVAGTASPDDPTMTHYWADRRRKHQRTLLSAQAYRRLWAQRGRCPACGGMLLYANEPPDSLREWERWLRTTMMGIGRGWITTAKVGSPPEIRLTHSFCRTRFPSNRQNGQNQSA
ncbi:hypothetical protein RB614_31455 [Phytohabitans sp. ZYX-F-186]|uniref:Core-binding (CB) domain-containing protein n=1 Tax=Phytohabitans maris TaxID=3071409 RepID=A0ABU0ZS25_9ACTN|nr:hypothetical protein [Phytohabitans sp. ZYX-F-186]MDQ7909050.1 hypothetical protein [Phytohabitans sp. ZYX-F-186]